MGYGMQSSAPPLAKAPRGYTNRQQQQFTPEQLKLFQGLFSHVGPESYLGKLAGGDESQFDQIEAPALRQFSGLQGNIASRFSGAGIGGRNSSGFQNEMSGAASDFAQQLQSQRQGLQQNAIRDLMGMSSQLLGQRPYEQSLVQKPSSGFGNFLNSALPVGGYFGSGGNR